MNINGTLSYASQEPWLFPSSIKKNILFGAKYNYKRYKETVRSCALDYDLLGLEHSDETLIADRGQNLSKGQQARINLARAVYRQCDIYLFDDSLTSLDEKVQEFIFNESITKMLKNKFVIMVSQNENHIKRANTVIVLDKGRISSIKEQNCVTEELLLDQTTCSQNTIIPNDSRNINISNGVTNEVGNFRKVYDEKKKQGKVELYVYKTYFQLGGGFLLFSVIICLYTLAQYFDSYSDKLLTSWYV